MPVAEHQRAEVMLVAVYGSLRPGAWRALPSGSLKRAGHQALKALGPPLGHCWLRGRFRNLPYYRALLPGGRRCQRAVLRPLQPPRAQALHRLDQYEGVHRRWPAAGEFRRDCRWVMGPGRRPVAAWVYLWPRPR